MRAAQVVVAGFFLILSVQDVLCLVIKPLQESERPSSMTDSVGRSTGTSVSQSKHRISGQEPFHRDLDHESRGVEQYPEFNVQGSASTFPRKTGVLYSGLDRSTSDSEVNVDRNNVHRFDKGSIDAFKASVWKKYFIRSRDLNKLLFMPEDDSQFPEGNTDSSMHNIPKSSTHIKDGISERSIPSQFTSDSHLNLKGKKALDPNPNNLDRTATIIPDSTRENENVLYPNHNSGSIPENRFPESKIISELYNMIENAEIMNKIEQPRYLEEETESLPSALRRFAKQNDLDRESYSKIWNGEKDWDFERIHFTTVTVGSLMLFLILVVMVLALRVHCRNREKTSQEWIRHPVVQPATAASGAVQPNFQHLIHSNHLNTEPIRIKAKGLLERRGSNTSLTIDLGPGNEGADVIFPTSKECTPENFLMTAGNRMGRRQLRVCLKDSRELHTEFWQIPTNHPDKCGVPGAAGKNRYRTVLPNEDTRVVLHRAPPDSPETPASQYINANYIRGFDGEERAYIATQGPLAHTVEDLWLLVLQERSPAIVMITRLKEKGRVKCEPYIPSYSASYGSIQVTVKQVIQKNGYTIRQIYLKRGDEFHTTLHFWFTSWPDHKTPSSARHLLAMAAEVEDARKETRGPVIVHCSAGIGRTGCFIAVSIGKKQLLEEDCVDVLGIVCQMRLDRGGMVQTAEQYEFIHRALALSEASLPSNSSID